MPLGTLEESAASAQAETKQRLDDIMGFLFLLRQDVDRIKDIRETSVVRLNVPTSTLQKGDVLAGADSGSSTIIVTRLPVGPNGYVLSAASGQTAGLQWIQAGTSNVVAVLNALRTNLPRP